MLFVYYCKALIYSAKSSTVLLNYFFKLCKALPNIKFLLNLNKHLEISFMLTSAKHYGKNLLLTDQESLV